MEADKRGSMPRVMELGEACSTAKASSAEAARTEARLRKMVVGENSLCADCKRVIDHRTAWASINLGAFVCIQCSGIHRAIGVHLSKVRAVAADDWNDDWVDNMERWGNARAGAFWEAAAPAHRPTGAGSEVASRAVADYIRAKYDQRLFAISGIEPGAWLRSTTLANGWSRFLDEGSNEWYYSRGDETTWDLPADAAPPPQQPAEWWAGHEGWLDKKSGGKDGSAKARLLQKWDRRYFVLGTSATAVYYYKTDAAYRKKEEPQGSLELRGGSAFLKEIKSGSHRFTLVTPGRELKLRAPSADYLAWAAALAPIVGEIAPGRGGADDDDDD